MIFDFKRIFFYKIAEKDIVQTMILRDLQEPLSFMIDMHNPYEVGICWQFEDKFLTDIYNVKEEKPRIIMRSKYIDDERNIKISYMIKTSKKSCYLVGLDGILFLCKVKFQANTKIKVIKDYSLHELETLTNKGDQNLLLNTTNNELEYKLFNNNRFDIHINKAEKPMIKCKYEGKPQIQVNKRQSIIKTRSQLQVPKDEEKSDSKLTLDSSTNNHEQQEHIPEIFHEQENIYGNYDLIIARFDSALKFRLQTPYFKNE